MEDERFDKILKRLDVIINLMLKQDTIMEGKMTGREQIKMLNSNGLDYKEIAQILGKSRSYIASELTGIKKRGRGK